MSVNDSPSIASTKAGRMDVFSQLPLKRGASPRAKVRRGGGGPGVEKRAIVNAWGSAVSSHSKM